jgi:FkbM family methyltransferase
MLGRVLSLVRDTRRHPIGKQSQFKSYFRIALWQVQARIQRGRIVKKWIDNSKLVLRLGMHGATQSHYFGLGEFCEMAFVLHLLREGDLFVDIGANVGCYAVLGAKICRANVICFEPAQETLPHLSANILANGIEDRVTVHECALGDRDGEVAFTIGLDSVNHVSDENDVNSRQVPVRRLDNIMLGLHPTMMKIDVEGFEDSVIAGAAMLLTAPSLLAIEIETVSPETRTVIENAGFRECFYEPFKRSLLDAPVGYAIHNRLFVRGREQIEERLRTASRRMIRGIKI